MINSSKSNSNNFLEGDKIKKAISDFNSKKRMINNIDINKVILSSLFSQLNEIHLSNRNKRFLKSIKNKAKIFYYLSKITVSIMIFRMQLKVEFYGKNSIWVLKQPGQLRPSYQKEFNDYTSNDCPPYLITWEKKKEINFQSLIRLIKFFGYVNLCNSKIYHFKHSFINARLSIFSEDLSNDILWKNLPTGVVSLKDFQGFENAIIQIANKKLIPTFTTQHAVHHFFKGKNFRQANIVLINSVANNILCWGNYLKDIFKDYYPNRKIILSSANLRPILNSKSKNNLSKDSYVFVFGGARHHDENCKLITLASKLDNKVKDCKIYFRSHPSVNPKKYFNFINDKKFRNDILIEDSSKLYHNFNYQKESIIITGMSGSYYDYLYLGYKVLFYNYGYDLLYDLPRALPKVENEKDFFSQIKLVKSIDNKDWKKKANIVLLQTINHEIGSRRQQNIIQDIEKLLSDKPSQIALN
jgi:hypothetical protein